MTNEESIKELNECYLIQSDGEGRRRNEAVTMAIEALAYREPKKPKFTHHCPVCESGLPYPKLIDEWCSCCYKPKFCPDCGQAIDWSDDND